MYYAYTSKSHLPNSSLKHAGKEGHALECVVSPSQLPPKHSLVLVCCPLPQVAVQLPHDDQLSQPTVGIKIKQQRYQRKFRKKMITF